MSSLTATEIDPPEQRSQTRLMRRARSRTKPRTPIHVSEPLLQVIVALRRWMQEQLTGPTLRLALACYAFTLNWWLFSWLPRLPFATTCIGAITIGAVVGRYCERRWPRPTSRHAATIKR